MAYRARHFQVKAKKSILFAIQEDIKEWRKDAVPKMRCKLIRGINQYLSVETGNQHAEESFFDIVEQYREQDNWVEVESVDYPY